MNAPASNLGWTEDRVARLKKLWGDGWSASQIATDLGGTTRNAVLGKVRRLKLSERRPQRIKPKPRSNGATKPASTSKPIEVAIAPPVAPVNDGPTIFEITELTKTTCRYPFGDPKQPGFGYCGGACSPDQPYCDGHMRKSVTAAPAPPTDQTKAPRRVMPRFGWIWGIGA